MRKCFKVFFSIAANRQLTRQRNGRTKAAAGGKRSSAADDLSR
ncbi:hypothetical protein [Desmonostoc muscorum]|nr:hypothetical protein [Desmonostoc muscorum]